jgi:hypothetical protein
MKNLKRVLGLGFFGLLTIMISSCGEDFNIGGGGTDIPDPTILSPTITFSNSSTYAQTGDVIEAGEEFKIQVTAAQGTGQLTSVTFTENGTNINLDRLKVNGSGIAANPLLLFNTDKTGFTWDVSILGNTASGQHIYEVIVADDNAKKTTQILTLTVESTPPTIENMGSSEISVAPGSVVSIKVNGSKGSSALEYIAVSEGPDLISDLSRLYLGSLSTPFTANPMLLPADWREGFSNEIFIRASAVAGSNTYRIFVIDENEEGHFFDIVISTGTSVGLIQGILFNAAGPVGKGGLDLDEAIGTGSSNAMAEIRDEGIDISRPTSENWNRQISAINGAQAKFVRAGATGISENYTFENIQYSEEINGLFDAGMSFIDTNSNGDLVSSIIVEGDSFAIKKGDKYYLIIIRSIVETLEDNGDHYIIDIKR